MIYVVKNIIAHRKKNIIIFGLLHWLIEVKIRQGSAKCQTLSKLIFWFRQLIANTAAWLALAYLPERIRNGKCPEV